MTHIKLKLRQVALYYHTCTSLCLGILYIPSSAALLTLYIFAFVQLASAIMRMSIRSYIAICRSTAILNIFISKKR